MALVDPAYKEQITEEVTRLYLARFPQYADQFSVHYCKSDDGVRVG